MHIQKTLDRRGENPCTLMEKHFHMINRNISYVFITDTVHKIEAKEDLLYIKLWSDWKNGFKSEKKKMKVLGWINKWQNDCAKQRELRYLGRITAYIGEQEIY